MSGNNKSGSSGRGTGSGGATGGKSGGSGSSSGKSGGSGSGSGSMKAPGQDFQISRDAFEKNPSGYFNDLHNQQKK